MTAQQQIKKAGGILLLITIVAASFFFGRLTREFEGGHSQKPESTDEKTILYWRAPMDPTEIYDHPGKSKMGMDLIPVYEENTEFQVDNAVLIDPVTVQNMGVRTEPVQRLDFSRVIHAVGKVQYDEENLFLVNTKVSGWIQTLHVHFVGDQVNRGDSLLEIYSPELVSTQQEYLLALKNYRLLSQSRLPSIQEDAEKLLISARNRLENWDIPPAEIERLNQFGEIQKTILLVAPATGIVVKRNAIEGAYIEAGQDLFEIADLNMVWVHASFYDHEIPWIRNGQPVKMALSYLPGKIYTGKVSYIYPYLREKTRDVHVRLIFPNPGLDLKPGMYANVELQGHLIPDALVVHSESVVRSGTRTIVFIAHGNGRFEPREVIIGEEGGPNNQYIRILAGLSGHEQIVSSAQFMLDSESQLQETLRKMLASSTDSEPPAADADTLTAPSAADETAPAERPHIH